MKRLRSLAVLFVAVYLLFAVGVQFHSDNDYQKGHPHCNLCQAAQVSFLETPSWHGTIELQTFGFIESLKPALQILLSDSPQTGRAPPRA